jgi:hypothetical protein
VSSFEVFQTKSQSKFNMVGSSRIVINGLPDCQTAPSPCRIKSRIQNPEFRSQNKRKSLTAGFSLIILNSGF